MENSHQILIRMCEEIDKANFARPEVYRKYEVFAQPIIDKVNTPQYSVTKTEAKFLIKFYAKKSLMKLGVGKQIKIELYSKSKMQRKYGRGNGKALPDGVRGVIAVSTPSEGKIVYSEQLIDDIASGNPDEMYRAFRTVMHETKHIEQSVVKQNSKESYIMALEAMAMHVDPYVYLNNYWGTYRECDAERYGMEMAQNELPGLFRVTDKTKSREIWNKFMDGLSGQTETVLGRICNERGNILLPGSVYPPGERIRIMEMIAEEYIRKYPKKAFDEFPVLKFAFRNNGKRKSVYELLEEIKYNTENDNNSVRAGMVEDIYLMIISSRFPESYERDSAEVYDFTRNNKMKNTFLERLSHVMSSLRYQDLRRREILRDFIEYGVGMSRASRLRRKAYFKKAVNTKRRMGFAYASQYYLEPGVQEETEKELQADSMSERYKIGVPIVDRTTLETDEKADVIQSKGESEESR